MNRHNITKTNQHGFRENRDTSNRIWKVIDFVNNSLNNNLNNRGIILDLAKVFDAVNHDILLHKVENMETKGKALNFIKSCLQGKQQRTKIGTTYSDYTDINCGVPRGIYKHC